jgi:hypothetical protein
MAGTSRHRAVPAALLAATIVAAIVPGALAENVDPAGSGEQYAWGENVGWLNAQPLGPGGPGLHAGDFWLTGWIWSENLGWINLSCFNRGTCDAAGFGVSNDGNGHLSGFAWGENVGWINFRPAGGGVAIDQATGLFRGLAWGENVGWINFDATAAGAAITIRTAWRCSPVPVPPSGSPVLTLEGAGPATTLSWTPVDGATGYDLVRGRLRELLESGGDFASAAVNCLSRRQPDTQYSGGHAGVEPPPGEAFWYLVRPANCGGAGTYDDDGPGLSGSRDAGILASGGDCG